VVPNSYRPKEAFGTEEVDLKQKTEIGFVGRLTIEKGFFDFVEVAKRMPHYTFRVAGDPSSIPEDLDIPSNLILEGLLNRDQMVQFYKKSKIILFLSHWYEGFPMVLLESMYYCTPLIVTNLGVMPEVIEHGVTGSVVPVGDIDAIIREVEKLYNDNDFYMDVIQKARHKTVTLYSENEYYKKVKALIEDKENN
jgi:glycosyltransferase involved in cell wall biosynthesis